MRQPSTVAKVALGAAAGLLSAAAGVGVSALASAALDGAPTPITAVGSRVIDATPGSLKDWAIRTLGTNDKPFLLAGIYTALALLACITGVIAWRSRATALGLTTALGIVGLLAAYKDPTQLVGPVARVTPAIAAILVSVALLYWFTHRWSAAASSASGTTTYGAASPADAAPAIDSLSAPHRSLAGATASPAAAPAGFDRRAFLAAAIASGVVATSGFAVSRSIPKAGAASRADIRLPRPTTPASPLDPKTTAGVAGVAAFLTSPADFYRVDTALTVPQVDAGSWRLKIHGMVDREVELSFQDLVDMPLTERRITLTCVSNEVGGPYVSTATWLGVLFTDLLESLGVSSDADAIKSTSADGFTIGTPLDALTDGRDAMVVIGMNGQPLPLERGFPARMVVPGLYGYVSATKWLVDLEVTTFSDFSAYWTDRGWDPQAPIKTMSRVDVPHSLEQLEAGTVPIAGIAWAQNTGIAKVEVNIDGGPWQEATLAAEDTVDTWRQWVYSWDATPGSHTIQARATDKSGYTQTSERAAPRPNGATGWQSVVVNVS